ncbi:MAG: hypothetical protein HQL22_02485 [Candidatus Omnitrophica bacterium]|nr:hypothetical protein [Candidatus Omnitrophota bacterium]
MSEEVIKNNKIRLTLWGVAAVLSVASFVLFVLNYQTLQQATVSAEKTAIKQSSNFRYYVNEYKETKVELDEANQKLVDLTQELEQANNDLTLTRSELSSVQQVNDQLKSSITVLERYKSRAAQKGEALEEMIGSFKKKNRELDSALQGVRKELTVFQPEINDANEGRSKVQIFKQHIRMVKQNMRILRQKAYEVHVAAQKEHDRLEALYGNGGFMVKDGQSKAVTTYGQKRIDIDVKFINK